MDLAELEPEVGAEVPGAPRFAVQNAIRAAAREFFVESRAWRHPFCVNPFCPVIHPSLPHDTFLVEAVNVSVDGRELPSGSFGMDNGNGITFAEGVRGREATGVLAVAPTADADELPDRLGNEFRDALVFGALARLMRVPGSEWTDPQRSGYYSMEFEEAKIRAATRAEDGFTRKRTRNVRYGGY